MSAEGHSPPPAAGKAAGVAGGSIEPGKDHYVRSLGKLIAILLARLYPTEWELDRASRNYERGIGAPVELSFRHSATKSIAEPGNAEGAGL